MAKNNMLNKLESMIPFFSATERKLGSFILEQPKDILHMSTSEIAKKSGVSEATVIRFSRKLGANGYTDFKILMSADLNHMTDQDSLMTDMKKDDTPIEIYKKLAAFTITSINTTANTLDNASLKKAVELIYSTHNTNKKIFLTGVGASSTLAAQMQVKLMRLNLTPIFFEDPHLQLESITNMKKDDILICFTTLGKSIQAHQYIDIANRRKAKVILVTQWGNQKLADKSTITLFISSVETNLRLASQTAITVQSMLIDTLFLALALKNIENITNDVKDTKTIFQEFGYYTT